MARRNQKILAVASLPLLVGLLSWSTMTMTQPPATSDQTGTDYEKLLEEANLPSRMVAHGVPGISFAIILDGQLDWARGYGIIQAGKPEKVNTETMFSVGSVSKVGTAVLTLKLQEQGVLDIDADVNTYLESWKVPTNEFTQEKAVTLRHIMSHTAGLTVHGFADFSPNESLPTTVQILNGSSPAKNSRVYVNIPVGSSFRYSGGGTTIEQMMIEDLTGLPFHRAAQDLLFGPTNMQRSSYQNPLPASFGSIAKAHNNNGRPVALPRGYQSMPEAAASGLWTTPSDFAKVMIMLMEAYEGKDGLLSPETVQDMMTSVSPGDYGLGPRMRKADGDVLFSHGGANDSYRAQFVGSCKTKNGIVIFTNGASGTALIRELLPLFEKVLF